MIDFDDLKNDLKSNLSIFLENFRLHNYILERRCIQREKAEFVNNILLTTVRVVDVLGAYYEYLNQKYADLENKIKTLEQEIEDKIGNNKSIQIKLLFKGIREAKKETEKTVYIKDYICNPNFFDEMLKKSKKSLTIESNIKQRGAFNIDDINALLSLISSKSYKKRYNEIKNLYKDTLLSLKPFSLTLTSQAKNKDNFPFYVHITPYNKISYNGNYNALYSIETPLNIMFSSCDEWMNFVFQFSSSLELKNIDKESLNAYYNLGTNKIYKTYFNEDFLIKILPYLNMPYNQVPSFLTDYLFTPKSILYSEKILEGCSSYNENIKAKTHIKC